MMNETNSKFEIRNSKQIQMTKAQNPKPVTADSAIREKQDGLNIGILNFEIVSDFEIRISDLLSLNSSFCIHHSVGGTS